MSNRSFFITGFATIALVVLSATWIYFTVNDNSHNGIAGGIILLASMFFLIWTALLLNRVKKTS